MTIEEQILATEAEISSLTVQLATANAQVIILTNKLNIENNNLINLQSQLNKKISNFSVQMTKPGSLRFSWTGPVARITVQGSATAPEIPVSNGDVQSPFEAIIPIADQWFGAFATGKANKLSLDISPSNYTPAPVYIPPVPPQLPPTNEPNPTDPIDPIVPQIGLPPTTKMLLQLSPSDIKQACLGKKSLRGVMKDGNYKYSQPIVGDKMEFVGASQPFPYKPPTVNLDGQKYQGFYCSKTTNHLFAGINLTNCLGNGFYLVDTDDILIQDCWYNWQGTGYFAWISGSKNTTLLRCVAPAMKGHNIDLVRSGPKAGNTAPSKDLKIIDCYAKRLEPSNPIVRIVTDTVLIDGCVFLNPGGNCVTLTDAASRPWGAKNVIIRNCTFDGNIKIYPNTDNVTIDNVKFLSGGLVMDDGGGYFSGLPNATNIKMTNSGPNAVGAINTWNAIKAAGL